jgi:hypothetical protein
MCLRSVEVVGRAVVDLPVHRGPENAAGDAPFPDEYPFYYDSDPSQYLRDWGDVFGDAADAYAVSDDWESFSAIAAVIDRRFASWSDG